MLGSENVENENSEKQLVRLVQGMASLRSLRRVEFSSTQWRRNGRSLWNPKLARMIATTRKKLFVARLTTPGDFARFVNLESKVK